MKQRRRTVRGRRGAVLVYSTIMLVVFLGLVSLGMDYAHCQSVKTEEQRSADLTARGLLQMYTTWGATTVGTYAPQLAYANAVDGKTNNGLCTPTIQWGTYDPTSGTFTNTGVLGSAVKVTMSRTAAGGNPVRLIFPLLTGNGKYPVKTTVDVSATAIAYYAGGTSGNVSVPSTANLYLVGMPAGSTTAGYGDTTSNSAPYQATCITVVPGTYITMTNTGGTTSVVPGTVSNSGPAGNASIAVHHGENYDHNPDPGYDNAENGIADATMNDDVLAGVFLNANAPTSAPAPTGRVDWTNSTQADQAVYSNIQKQQPFMIGTGQTTAGVTKQFLVPPGATRLYLGIWDGVCYNNNSGTLTGTLTVNQKIMLVQ